MDLPPRHCSRPASSHRCGIMTLIFVTQTTTKLAVGVSYKYWYPDEESTQYLYETYPDVSFCNLDMTGIVVMATADTSTMRLAEAYLLSAKISGTPC